jgi:uncharacterized protein
MIAIADTSFVLAVANSSDSKHPICVSVFNHAQTIYLPQSTLNEVCYMLGTRGGSRAVVQFLLALPQMKYRLLPLEAIDLARTAELLNKYADARPDFVDVTLVAIAERLNISTILTLDKRDFSLIVPRHAEYLTLLPDE